MLQYNNKNKYILSSESKGTNKSRIVISTFQQLNDLINNKIIISPYEQVDLNQDKIDEMKLSYKANPHHFLSRCLISISHKKIGDEEHYWLVDGQHRTNMAIQLFKEDNINDNLFLSIIEVDSKDEFDILYSDLNKDSQKFKLKNYTVFAKEIYYKLKEIFTKDKQYSFVPTKSSIRTKLYTLSEFCDLLISKNITKENPQKLYEYIKEKEQIFFNDFKYLENKNIYMKGEQDSIDYRSCIFMKQNNFIDWLIDPTIKKTHEKIKPIISKELKKQVWQKYNESNDTSNCIFFKCPNIMQFDKISSWVICNDISLKNNGNNDLTNLFPACKSCSKQLGDMNKSEYELIIYKKYCIDTYFDENEDEIECKKRGCKNKIVKDEFICEFNKNKDKLKPICFDH